MFSLWSKIAILFCLACLVGFKCTWVFCRYCLLHWRAKSGAVILGCMLAMCDGVVKGTFCESNILVVVDGNYSVCFWEEGSFNSIIG